MQKLLIFILCCSAALSACSAHKIEIQQGNLLDSEQIAQIQPGMSMRQVKFILGTPLIIDPFHQGRWDYVYRTTGLEPAQQAYRLTLYFEGETLSRLEQVELPAQSTASRP